jgi:hypothetical protein
MSDHGQSRAFKEILWPFEARIFEFWLRFCDGACPRRPVTEPKRSQNSKRPRSLEALKRLQNFFNRSRSIKVNQGGFLGFSFSVLPVSFSDYPALTKVKVIQARLKSFITICISGRCIDFRSVKLFSVIVGQPSFLFA